MLVVALEEIGQTTSFDRRRVFVHLVENLVEQKCAVYCQGVQHVRRCRAVDEILLSAHTTKFAKLGLQVIDCFLKALDSIQERMIFGDQIASVLDQIVGHFDILQAELFINQAVEIRSLKDRLTDN